MLARRALVLARPAVRRGMQSSSRCVQLWSSGPRSESFSRGPGNASILLSAAALGAAMAYATSATKEDPAQCASMFKSSSSKGCGNPDCTCGKDCTCGPNCTCGKSKEKASSTGGCGKADCKCGKDCQCGKDCSCGAEAECSCVAMGDEPHTVQINSPDFLSKPSDFWYPPIEPYNKGMLKVSDKHTLYYEECGNPNGKPVVILHGGPGGGCNADMRRYHDPKAYRIILFDQRGCGRSTPHACLDDNTTWHLVGDIERLRRHLNIDKWQVFGGSWGSTLSVTYAETHPSHVTELVLRGIFLLRKQEVDFYYQHGSNFIYPERFEAFRDAIPEEERDDFVTAYHKRLTSNDPKVRLPAAVAWTTWEKLTSNLIPPAPPAKDEEAEKFAEAFARIENHYFINKGFFPTDNFLLENVHKIRDIPTIIVQGRYDVVCPIKTAWELHRAFPESYLRIIQTAGHSAMEPGIVKELVAATDRFRTTRG